MPATIDVNGLSLCHKGSEGFIKNTLPDVCKTPDKCLPVGYDIVSFSKDLVKGTTSVLADGGNPCAILGSELRTCTGDEAGTCGGILSGTRGGEATWMTYSPDVFMEGQPVCRHTDKMWMNHGNTVGMAGKQIRWNKGDDPTMDELCDIACSYRGAASRQDCVADAIKKEYYEEVEKTYKGSKKKYKALYPRDFDNGICQEVSMIKQEGSWTILLNQAKTASTSNPITPRGGIRPDILCRSGGQNTKLVEIKFKGDVLSRNQRRNYPQAAKDLGAKPHVLDVEKHCDCHDGGRGGTAPATAPVPARGELPESSDGFWRSAGWAGLGVLAAFGIAAAIFISLRWAGRRSRLGLCGRHRLRECI